MEKPTPQTIAIIGAGAMGAALTTPAARAGHIVRLWGTWLDDSLLAAVRANEPHPRLGVRLDPRVEPYDSTQLENALAAVDLVALAIASDGVVRVAELVAKHLPPEVPIVMMTKGFGRDGHGRVRLLPALLHPMLDAATLVGAGGPCKANEVAIGRPTATVFAGTDATVVRRAARTFATSEYRVETSSDLTGVELAAATKNVYAIALGVCDGLGETATDAMPWHNLKAATFARAAREMRLLATALHGTADTVHGLAGVGDLEVTGLSGRNKVYGARLGRGERAGQALAQMRDAGQTVEGVSAAGYALELARQLAVAGTVTLDQVP